MNPCSIVLKQSFNPIIWKIEQVSGTTRLIKNKLNVVTLFRHVNTVK